MWQTSGSGSLVAIKVWQTSGSGKLVAKTMWQTSGSGRPFLKNRGKLVMWQISGKASHPALVQLMDKFSVTKFAVIYGPFVTELAL